MSAATVEVSRTVILTDLQRSELEAELIQASVERQPAIPEDRSFYDNEDLALTIRGFWLSYCATPPGSWLLQVPIYEPVANPSGGDSIGARFVKHEETSTPQDILDRLGLVEHAKLYRAGKATNMQKLLKQAGVVVCAPISSKRSLFTWRRGAESEKTSRSCRFAALCSSTEDDCRSLSISIDALRLDANCAENQALANLLFSMGNAAPSALKPAVAKFTLTTQASSELSKDETISKLRSDLAACIIDSGLGAVLPEIEIPPSFWAHLATLRPAHLRALYKGNVFISRRGLADSQDGDGLPSSTAAAAAGLMAPAAVEAVDEDKVE